MVESSPTRVRMGKAEVIPLTELVNTSLKNLQQLFELKDPDLRYILIDAESYVDDSFITDPIRRIIGYALMVNNLGKKVVVFNIGEVADRNLRLSRGYEALARLGVGYTAKGLNEVLSEYQ